MGTLNSGVPQELNIENSKIFYFIEGQLYNNYWLASFVKTSTKLVEVFFMF